MPYRICLISLGCAKNQVNSEQMLYLLNQAGHDVVGEVDGCDVAIVNTCGFIDTAKSEAIDQILQLAEVKKAGGLKKILVTGCLSQRYENDILESLPEVDGMLGTGSFGEICQAVEDVMHGGKPLYFGDKSAPIEEIGRVIRPVRAGRICASPRGATTGAHFAPSPPSAAATAAVRSMPSCRRRRTSRRSASRS